ncbi:MAG TPA: hypothetical protein VNN12_01930, partial [Dehalococcoidia bacterium]|nr:hypothetical protein [Dehalococcoidia bacterium]
MKRDQHRPVHLRFALGSLLTCLTLSAAAGYIGGAIAEARVRQATGASAAAAVGPQIAAAFEAGGRTGVQLETAAQAALAGPVKSVRILDPAGEAVFRAGDTAAP